MQYARDCTGGRRRYEYLWFRNMSLNISILQNAICTWGRRGVMNICG
jgi:hypothetical protein